MPKANHRKTRQLHTVEIQQIKKNYRLTQDDANMLFSLLPVAKVMFLDLKKEFYAFIFTFEHAKVFLNSGEIMKKHQVALEGWFVDLFSGKYDTAHFNKLNKISETHVKIGLPSHYVNAAFSFVRQFLHKYLMETQNTDILASMHKIIDINLDILSLTYNKEAQQKLLKEVQIIKCAVQNNTIEPYVQPIVHAQSAEVSKYECLMRIHDLRSGEIHSISPFLSTAKEVLLYEGLMKQMIDKSFAIFETLPYDFSLNLGYDDILNQTSCEHLYGVLRKFPNTQRVIFEILETDSIIDFDIVIAFIEKVKAFGCKIAIDDFGSGYSNIENILKLKPDYIKIDGSLISEIDSSPEALTIVKNILNMAEDIEAKTIAEYVHNKDIFEILKGLNLDFMQGYYISKPFPGKELLNQKPL